MHPDFGAFLEEFRTDGRRLVLRMKDLWEGLGADVQTSLRSRRLDGARGDRVFVRLRAADPGVVLFFPAGSSLFDPGRRLQPVGPETRSVHLRDEGDLDLEVRRLVEAAYREAAPPK